MRFQPTAFILQLFILTKESLPGLKKYHIGFEDTSRCVDGIGVGGQRCCWPEE